MVPAQKAGKELIKEQDTDAQLLLQQQHACQSVTCAGASL